MAADGRSIPPGNSRQHVNPTNSSTDSFKEDIQAIGRAVERLREGLASGSSEPSSKLAPGHDSSSWNRPLSSSTLASGVSLTLRSESYGVVGVLTPAEQERQSSRIVGGWSAGRRRGRGSVDERSPEPPTGLQTSFSHGHLSINELCSEERGGRSFRANEGPLAIGSRATSSLLHAGRGPELAARSKVAEKVGVGSSPRSSGIEQCVDQRSEEGLASRHRAGGEIALSTGMLDSDLEQPPAMASTVDEPERKIGETLSEGGEVGSDGRSISSSQKRRSRGQGEVRGRYGGKGEDGEKNIAETGSLFELRDALKAREEELLRLNRDVAAVATSSGGFRLLAAAMAGEDDKGQGPESAVAAVANNATRIGLSVDLRGDNYDDRYMSCYSSSLFDGISRVTGTDDAGASAVGDIFGGDKRGAAEATWSNTRELGVIPSEIGVSQASDGGKQRDAIFSRRAALLPPPIVSGVGAPSNGSPLVASAFEGLRQMRVVLQERELDASIAKDDAKKMHDRISELSTRLRRSERKCKAQENKIVETQAELRAARAEAAETARVASSSKQTVEAIRKEAGDRAAAMRELDDEVLNLKERLQIASGELQKGKASAALVQARLDASAREVRHARERLRKAEDELTERAEAAARDVGSLAESAKEISSLRTLVEEGRAEVERAQAETKAAVAGLRAAEEEGRRQAREAASAREQLRAERTGSARISLELEAATRERTQAMEKLSAAEAETGRLHVELASALAAAEKHKAVAREGTSIWESFRAAEAELVQLRASLTLARQEQDSERRRAEQESSRAIGLAEELTASEARRNTQEDDISRARDQVAKLAAQVEGERKAMTAGQNAAEAREARVRASLDKAEADLRAMREREQEAAGYVANLKAEVTARCDELTTAETALTAALERARLAEATAQSRLREIERAAQNATNTAEISRQDKETLKRGLVAAQAQAAEVRAEYGRLLAEFERLKAARSSLSAAATGGGSGSGSYRPGDESTTAAVAAAAEAAVAEAAEAAAKSAVATALEMRRELEERLALAQAEAMEARTESQRLKSKVKAMAAAAVTTSGAGATKPVSSSTFLDATGARPSEDAVGRRPGSAHRDRYRDVDSGRSDTRAWEHQALLEACSMMKRVSSALSDAVDGNETDSPPARRGPTDLDPRWASDPKRGHAKTGPGGVRVSGRRRRGRALSADSLGEGGVVGFRVGEDVARWEDGEQNESSSTNKVRRIVERLRSSVATVLAARREERAVADRHKSRLQEDLRNSEAREAETAARLEESRELSREQTSFVEGVWQERRRLETELGVRREEVERLRASEDAARTTAALLEGRVEDLSLALRKKQGQANRGAGEMNAAGYEAREAVEALRRQLDDLRREVDNTKRDQARKDKSAHKEESVRVGHSARINPPWATGPSRSGGSGHDATEMPGEAKRSGPTAERRDNGREGPAEEGSGIASVVLEGEFQRLRAKYEKAKGRIAALEEQVAAGRRASAHARREFQGALEALKMSQALLLKIQKGRRRDDGNNDAEYATLEGSRPTTTTPTSVGAPAPPQLPSGGNTADPHESRPAQSPTPSQHGRALPNDANAHAHALALQASMLRDMSRSVKGLLQLATGEVEGARQATGDAVSGGDEHSSGATPPPASSAVARSAAAATTQTDEEVVGRVAVDKLVEDVRVAQKVAQRLEAEKARLDVALSEATAELAEVRELLSTKATQVLGMEARIAQAEFEQRESREVALLATNRAKDAEASGIALRATLDTKERELSDAKHRLHTFAATEAELRARCEELALASSAFAAEVARQKESRAKWQEQSRLASTTAGELRKRCADLVRASEASVAERARLEKELSSARSESQEIDADVAQVLDALASSEKERQRLQGELERQSRVAEEARHAVKLAEGAAADVHKCVDEERAALHERAGRLEGVVQVGASRLKESLDTETKRRVALEQECKALASRVTELEAALILASAEARKTAKLAAETGALHKRDTASLIEEVSRLRSALRAETANVREALEHAAAQGSTWVEERRILQQDAAKAKEKEALAQADVAYLAEASERLLDAEQRQEDESVALRKEIAEMTDALKAETARANNASDASARAVREAAALTRKMSELEVALYKAKSGAREADKAARKSTDRAYRLQEEMRSAVTLSAASPPPSLPEAPRDEEDVAASYRPRQLQPHDEEERDISNCRGTRDSLEQERCEPFPPLPPDGVNVDEDGYQDDNQRRTGSSTSPADRKLSAETVVSTDESDSGYANLPQADANTSAVDVDVWPDGGGEARARGILVPALEQREEHSARSGSSFAGGESQNLAAMGPQISGLGGSSGSSRASSRSVSPAGGPRQETNMGMLPSKHGNLSSAPVSPTSTQGGGGSPTHSYGSSAALQSGTSVTITTSGASSSVQLPAERSGGTTRGQSRNHLLPVRSGSIVVRDWKAGQQEAFSELDRKASSSSVGVIGNSTGGGRPV